MSKDKLIQKQAELIEKLQSMVDSGQDYDRDYHEILIEFQALKSAQEPIMSAEEFLKDRFKNEFIISRYPINTSSLDWEDIIKVIEDYKNQPYGKE